MVASSVMISGDATMQITHLTLQTHSLQAQYDFYVDTFGMQLLTADTAQFTVQAGATTLTFAESHGAATPNYHFAFNVPPAQFDDAILWITGRVPLVAHDTGDTQFSGSPVWDARMTYFYDPAGNIVEFIGRNRLHREVNTSFSSNSVMAISEIGLATTNVQLLVETLNRELTLPTFDGAGSDTFTAAGDDHGLFIVVHEGRTWFPTRGHQAVISPMQARIIGNRDTQFTSEDGQYQIDVVSSR
ncbi:MAG: VOC family protein [Chloroflexota bacterium]|nr:VOC family protein [Chloroflexota bacterium]